MNDRHAIIFAASGQTSQRAVSAMPHGIRQAVPRLHLE
jgi:hypothetical protein